MESLCNPYIIYSLIPSEVPARNVCFFRFGDWGLEHRIRGNAMFVWVLMSAVIGKKDRLATNCDFRVSLLAWNPA